MVVVILILFSMTDELALYHTMCAGGQRIRRKLYESNGRGQVNREDVD